MEHATLRRTLLKFAALLALTSLALAACTPMPTETFAPTEMPATSVPTEEPEPTDTMAPTDTPAPTETPESEPTDTPTAAPTPSPDEMVSMGEPLFTNNCSACHQSDGQGVEGAFPALSGNPLVTAEDPQAVIQRVLFGWGGMPGFQGDLSAEEIAAVLSYIRNTWENDASVIRAETVEEVMEAAMSQ